MPESIIAAHVAAVRAYLATDEGRREIRRIMACFGYSYEAVIAQKVCWLCNLVRYEDILKVVDLVVIAELAPVSGEAA